MRNPPRLFPPLYAAPSAALSVIISLLALLLSACSPIVRPEQPVQSGFASLSAGGRLGQSFTAHYDGLTSIAVFLKPGEAPQGTVRLALTDAAGETAAQSSLPLEAIQAPGFYRFNFPTLSRSRSVDYTLELSIDGQGSLLAGSAPGETYLHGALYENGAPQDAQLNFRLVYDPAQLATGLAREGAGWLLLLLAAAFLLVLPGWGLMALLWRGWQSQDFGSKLALSSGVGLALYPLLFLWAGLVGLRPGMWFAVVPPALGLGAIIYKGKGRFPSPPLSPFPSYALTILLLAIFFARFFTVRGLDAPLWGDSVQHTAITQLFVDQGGLFTSWLPYAPYQTFTVHYGFSSIAALLVWLGQLGGGLLTAAGATLFAGQILNGLAALALYPLAVKISGGQGWAGVGAVLAAGLLSPMPAFYVNWGRYAQLAGQAVLPVAIWLAWEAVEQAVQPPVPRPGSTAQDRKAPLQGLPWGGFVLAGGVLAGMMLHYYRMPFYYGLFIVAWLLFWALPRWRSAWDCWKWAFVSLVIVAALGLVLFAPRLPGLMGSSLGEAVGAGVTVGSNLEYVRNDYQAWRELNLYLPQSIQILAGLGLLIGLARRNWMALGVAAWAGLLSAVVAGQLIRLPGANLMQSFAVLIALYIPAGLLIGLLTSEAAGFATHRLGGWSELASLALVASLAIWGAAGQRNLTQPGTFALVTRPDAKAMRWIRQHTPENARFLVEGFRIYGGMSAVGADAGWWIPLLARRRNTMPPQYALMNEASDPPGYTQAVIDLTAALERASPASPEGMAALCAAGVTHIYVGQRQGLIGTGTMQLYTAFELEGSPFLQAVYAQDRVRVFAVRPGMCAAGRFIGGAR